MFLAARERTSLRVRDHFFSFTASERWKDEGGGRVSEVRAVSIKDVERIVAPEARAVRNFWVRIMAGAARWVQVRGSWTTRMPRERSFRWWVLVMDSVILNYTIGRYRDVRTLSASSCAGLFIHLA